jgi:hypothetical protein
MNHFLDVETSEDDEYKPCFIHGIAYAQGMKYRVTDTLNPKITDPENDPNYLWDPAVRLTHEQMGQDMTGLPMLFEHDHRLRVGTILHNFLDDDKHLNIVAEVDQKTNLGKWVARNVRAGLLQDLSIGYPTGFQPRTRKVQHKDNIEEVSIVIGGFLPGCEVKVRASKNRGYKNPRQQQESSKQIRIVRVMATAGEVQSQQPPAAAAPTEPETPKMDDPQDLIDLAMLKKMMIQLQAENARLVAKDQIHMDSEKKRREEYAISNQPKYEEAMAIVEELAKEDGEPVSDQYKEELKYSALNPEGKHMFQNTVRVTASVRKLKAEKAALAKQVEDMVKENALRKDMLQDVALLAATPERDQKRADKVAQRNAEQQQPLDAIMTPDPEAPHTKPPAWLMGLTGRQMGQSDAVWRTHGIDTNPNPPIQEPVAQPVAVPAAVPPTLAAEQSKGATPVHVNASLQTQQRAAPTTFRSSYNGSKIQYPRMQGMAASREHTGVWNFLNSIDDSQGFMSGGHLAGKDFGIGH